MAAQHMDFKHDADRNLLVWCSLRPRPSGPRNGWVAVLDTDHGRICSGCKTDVSHRLKASA